MPFLARIGPSTLLISNCTPICARKLQPLISRSSTHAVLACAGCQTTQGALHARGAHTIPVHRPGELSEAAFHKAADHVLDLLTEQLEVRYDSVETCLRVTCRPW